MYVLTPESKYFLTKRVYEILYGNASDNTAVL